MNFFQRTLQRFFLIFGLILVGTFLLRWIAPASRTVLWELFCPANTQIEISPGQAELDPGEVVSAYEVACVGSGVRQPISDLQLTLIEMGSSLALAGILAVFLSWMSSRKLRSQTLIPTGIL